MEDEKHDKKPPLRAALSVKARMHSERNKVSLDLEDKKVRKDRLRSYSKQVNLNYRHGALNSNSGVELKKRATSVSSA